MHGIGSREDLPLPLWLVILASALILILTFVGLLRSHDSPHTTKKRGVPLPRLTRLLDAPATVWSGRIVTFAVGGLVLVSLFFGPDKITNPALGFIYVWLWVGLVPLSLLLGPVLRWLSFPRALLSLIHRNSNHGDGDSIKLGVWPASIAITAFLFLELVQPQNTRTSVIAVWVVAYLVWTLSGALLRGSGWIASADPFESYSTLVARSSPWQRIHGAINLVSPIRHLVTAKMPSGSALLALVLLAGSLFDSLSGSLWWAQLTQQSSIAGWIWASIGLGATITLVVLLFLVACRLQHVRETSIWGEADRVSASLIPLVIGYAVAHYGTLFIVEGQRTAINFSDPLGTGANWFGTAELGVNTGLLLAPTVVAMSQVVFIVAGHVIGIVVYHQLFLASQYGVRLEPSQENGRSQPLDHRSRDNQSADAELGSPSSFTMARRAVIGQLPMLIVMVGFTTAGLWLLFQP